MRIYHDDGVLEISGTDIALLAHVVDEHDVSAVAGISARRVVAAQNHAAGMSWSKARKAAADATATDEMRTVVRDILSRGGNPQQAIHAAMLAGRP